MAILYEFFVAIVLTSSHQLVGQEIIYTDHDKISATTWLDKDINLTVGNICRHLPDFYCILSDSVYIREGICLTSQDGTIADVGLCPYFPIEYSWLRLSDYYSLPSNRTVMEHSNLTCGPYNREGLLCSKCKPGYGPAVYSFTLMCAECSDNGVGWALYLFLVLFPITVFYIIVIIFNIRATAPPFTAFVMMCQVYCTIELIHVPLQMKLKHNMQSLSLLIHVDRVLTGIWNLDFFRYLLPPFCVSSHLSNIQALNLEYILIIYPFLLIIFTSLCIELHARNFRPIVLLWKPFHRMVIRLRRSWDPRASIINAFSTFLLLILSKSIVITGNSIMDTYLMLQNPVPDKIQYNSFLYADPVIRAYSKQHLPYLLSSSLLLIMLFGLPTLLLCLYPTKIFRRLLSNCVSVRWQQAIGAFIDTFQGHYKDGTNGTRDYRAASTIHLLVVFLIIYASAGCHRRYFILDYMQFGFVAVSLFYSLARPCKKKYANIIQSLLYALTAFVIFMITSARSHKHTVIFLYFLIAFLCLLTPHIILSIYVIYKVFKRIGLDTYLLRKLSCKLGSCVYQHNEQSPLLAVNNDKEDSNY